ncbi:hypothetical protein T440DRAFT_269181 [Plenodomus tracheiphilus IPT5]|uniref:Uncharacterized protein n=1 Tax=Plenodomus tracheiphilus IPT5 TaxID=1408161 RepID=A0A6A7BFD9_9PLEO|nr:hypothetical protein T440DRAFT_269181 [Plenodomus tracheiphilus IPT5]
MASRKPWTRAEGRSRRRSGARIWKRTLPENVRNLQSKRCFLLQSMTAWGYHTVRANRPSRLGPCPSHYIRCHQG